jgi:nitroreductase
MRRGEISSETTGAFWTAVLDNADARFETDEHYRRGILTGVGAAIQALWLAATGVGASLQFQTSVIVLTKPKNQLRSILSIPESHEPLFLIRIGYPERDSHYRNIRRPFHQVISRP